MIVFTHISNKNSVLKNHSHLHGTVVWCAMQRSACSTQFFSHFPTTIYYMNVKLPWCISSCLCTLAIKTQIPLCKICRPEKLSSCHNCRSKSGRLTNSFFSGSCYVIFYSGWVSTSFLRVILKITHEGSSVGRPGQFRPN